MRGLHVERGARVLSPQDVTKAGKQPDVTLGLSFETWVAVLTGAQDLWVAVDEGIVSVHGDTQLLKMVFNSLDVQALQSD